MHIDRYGQVRFKQDEVALPLMDVTLIYPEQFDDLDYLYIEDYLENEYDPD